MSITCEEEVQRISRAYGPEVTKERAAYILWEYTGFPSFWPDPTRPAHWNMRRQVRKYFKLHRAGLEECFVCNEATPIKELVWRVCDSCMAKIDRHAA